MNNSKLPNNSFFIITCMTLYNIHAGFSANNYMNLYLKKIIDN